MTRETPPRTKSAAHRMGDVPCPGCNEAGIDVDKIATAVNCAWCWDDAIKAHRRFVKLTRWIEWQAEHGEGEEPPTSPESRSAFTPVPPTDRDPNAK